MNPLLPMFVGVFVAAFALEAKQRNRRGLDLPLVRGMRDLRRGFEEGYHGRVPPPRRPRPARAPAERGGSR